MFRQPLFTLLFGFLLASATLDGIAGEKKTSLLEEKGDLKKNDISYPVKLEADKVYRIELKSDKFDAYLKLEHDGKTVAEDDDSAGGLNARIYFKPEKAGEYTVVVNSKNRQVGPFTLKVTLATDRKIASEYPDKTIDLKWADGKAQYKGVLAQNDGVALGRYYKVFAVKLEKGKRYQIDHRSADFDAYLLLEDADGKRLADNDDGGEGEGVNARLAFTPPKTAIYRVIATSLPTRRVGAFVLDIAPIKSKNDRHRSNAPRIGVMLRRANRQWSAPRFYMEMISIGLVTYYPGVFTMNLHRTLWLSAAALTLGLFIGSSPRAVAGDKDVILSKSDSLTEKDEHDAKMKSSYCKVFTVKLTEGHAYKIDLSSKDFDSLLRIEDAKKKQLAENDDFAPPSLDSRLIFIAPKTGAYRIIATTFAGSKDKTGLFTLEVVKATEAEAKVARLMNRIDRYASLPEKDRKEVASELTKQFQAKEGKLTIADARLAIEFYSAAEDVGIKHAKEICDSLTKIFGDADNKNVASLSKYLNDSYKKSAKFLGKEFPVTGKTVDGKEFDLKKLKGKVVLVDFWATWCGPCIGEIPNMLDAHNKYAKRGFEIIGVSLDRDDDDIVQFNEKRKIPWKSINIEDSRKLANEYGVNSIPFPVLIDRAGHVVSLRARGPQLDRLLERLFPDEKK